jgi:hypothetical protein
MAFTVPSASVASARSRAGVSPAAARRSIAVAPSATWRTASCTAARPDNRLATTSCVAATIVIASTTTETSLVSVPAAGRAAADMSSSEAFHGLMWCRPRSVRTSTLSAAGPVP